MRHVGMCHEPLVRLSRRSPLAFRVLYGSLGWLARAYMREIRAPGSSRLGRMLLTIGLPICGWLGSRSPIVMQEETRCERC